MRKLISTIVICFLALQASAQFNLEFHTGYGKYSLDDVKGYQSSVKAGYPAGAAITESFPAFWYYGVDARWSLDKALLGMSISRGSSGGQVYYRDFTGFASDRELLTYSSFRTITAVKWSLSEGRWIISFNPGLGIVFGKMNISTSINVENGNQSHVIAVTNDYKRANVFLEPTLSVSRRFGFFGITAFAGYHADLGTNAFKDKNSWTIPANTTNKTVTMNLSGYRVGGSVGFYMSRSTPASFKRLYLSPGLGLEFGGIGLNAMIMASEQIGFFAGMGYNLNGVGVNGGAQAYTNKQNARIRPYFSVMYGYNAVILIKDRDDLNKTFYGATGGFGIDLNNHASGCWTFALHVPIRVSDVNQYIDHLKASNGVKIERALLPFTISIGYRFIIN